MPTDEDRLDTGNFEFNIEDEESKMKSESSGKDGVKFHTSEFSFAGSTPDNSMMSDKAAILSQRSASKDLSMAGEKDAMVLDQANQPTFSSSVIKEIHGGRVQAEPEIQMMQTLSDEEIKGEN